VVFADPEPGLADEARLRCDRLTALVRVDERATGRCVEGPTIQRQGRVLGLCRQRRVWRWGSPVRVVVVLVRAYEREPCRDGFLGAPHFVQGVPNQIIHSVRALVGRKRACQGLVEDDRRREVGRCRQVVFGGEVTGLTSDLRIVVELLEIEGASLEIKLAQAKHGVRGVLRVLRVVADELFEDSNRTFAGLVERSLLCFELLAIPAVALAALLEVLAPHQ